MQNFGTIKSALRNDTSSCSFTRRPICFEFLSAHGFHSLFCLLFVVWVECFSPRIRDAYHGASLCEAFNKAWRAERGLQDNASVASAENRDAGDDACDMPERDQGIL